MNKILHITVREFLATVGTKAFIIGVLITPAMLGIVFSVFRYIDFDKPPKMANMLGGYVAENPDFDVGGLMKRATPGLSEAERAAYEAPFPDVSFKAGVRRFPAIVPVTEDMEGVAESRRAAEWWSEQWSGPTFMAIGAQDPVLGPPVMYKLATIIRGCPEPEVFEEAGHFVQEHGAPVAEAALAAFEAQAA